MFWACTLVFTSWQPHDFVSASQQRELELKEQKVPGHRTQLRTVGWNERQARLIRKTTLLPSGHTAHIRPMFCPCSLEGQLKSSCWRNKQFRFGCWQLSVLPVMDDKGGFCVILSSPSAHFQSQDILLKIHSLSFLSLIFSFLILFLRNKIPAVLQGPCACWAIMLCLVYLPKLPERFRIMCKMYFQVYTRLWVS